MIPRNTTGHSQSPTLATIQQSSFLTHRSTPPTTPSPVGPNPRNNAFRANVQPDFIRRQTGRQTAPLAQPRNSAPASISDQYNLARQQLTNFAPQQGFATEKQRRDFAWEVRNNPLGARDAAQDFQRMYQRSPSPSSTSPTRPTNFSGPRPRFTA